MSQKLCYQVGLYLRRNSSTILTCLGALGVAATVVSAVKATPKALELIAEATDEKGEELTAMETVKVAGKVYIPTVSLGVSTIACIFGANALNKQQQAALTSAYALLDSTYKEYSGKLKELYGEETDICIREAIEKEHCEKKYVEAPGIRSIDTSGETKLFYESYRDGYFESTMEAVINAEYHFNRNFSMRGYAGLNEFYDFLGLAPTREGSVLGWDCQKLIEGYESTWIDFDHRLTTLDDGLEVYIIDYPIPPEIDYDSWDD